MSDLVKAILPFLGHSLLFLEGEVGITLSLGYLLALTVADSTPLVFVRMSQCGLPPF